MLNSIEQSILVSILESDFVFTDKRILQVELNPDYFTNKIHRTIVNGINTLRKSGEPVNTDYFKAKSAKKWSFELEATMLVIISHNPIASFESFTHYYNLLKKNYLESYHKRIAI